MVNFLGFLIPPWIKIVAYLVLIVSILSSVYFALHKAYMWAYTNGVTATDLQWTTRENVQVVTANNKIVQLEQDARKKESEQGINVANIVDTYEKEKQNAKIENDATINNLNNGIIKLRDKYAASSTSTCSSSTSAIATNTPSDSQKTGTELSQTTAQFLLGLTNEADDIVLQLTACQALLISDRQTCNTNL